MYLKGMCGKIMIRLVSNGMFSHWSFNKFIQLLHAQNMEHSRVHCHIYMCLPFVPNVSQMYAIHVTFCYFKIHFNTAIPSVPRVSEWFCPLKFTHQNPV